MKVLSKVCLILGIVVLVWGIISALTFTILGARTLATGSALLLLLSIAINTQK